MTRRYFGRLAALVTGALALPWSRSASATPPPKHWAICGSEVLGRVMASPRFETRRDLTELVPPGVTKIGTLDGQWLVCVDTDPSVRADQYILGSAPGTKYAERMDMMSRFHRIVAGQESRVGEFTPHLRSGILIQGDRVLVEGPWSMRDVEEFLS